LLQEPAARGSPQLLAKLTDDLVTDLTAADLRRVAPIRPALKPWIAAASVALSTMALSMLPWLDLPALIARQLMPWRTIAAVTTTRLSVEPGDADGIQGQPLTVRARVQHLSVGDVSIRLSSDGQTWQTQPMLLGSGPGAADR